MQFKVTLTIYRGGMVMFNGTENFCQKKKKENELYLVVQSATGLKCGMQEVRHLNFN